MSKLFSGDETNYRLHLDDDKWYYRKEINTLENVDSFQIVIYDGDGNKTKFLSLNKDSIEVLREFLDMFEKK